MLIYPMLDDRTSSIRDAGEFVGEVGWNPAQNRFGWEALLGHAPGGEGVSPYAAPARASDLAGLPPTYISCGALDLFVEEDMDYARRLMRAGVATELHIYPGAFHGYEFAAQASVSIASERERRVALARAFGVSPASLGGVVELQPGEAGVEAALGHQRVVRALLDDAAVVHHDDPVGAADGGEAVGDDDRRAVVHQPLERLLDQPLGFGVERGGRLVEQQDRRVAQQRAGDREALALAARQPRAAFAQEGVEPVAAACAGIRRRWRPRRRPRSRRRSRPSRP